MALVGPVFLDTSVLVGGLIELGEPDSPAQRLMDGLAAGTIDEPATAWHCCLELYSVSTRLPREYRLSPAEAALLLSSEVLGRLTVHQLPADAYRGLVELLARDEIRGGRAYDSHIAQIARFAGARTVVTDNQRHFTSLLRSSIAVLTAAEAITELG